MMLNEYRLVGFRLLLLGVAVAALTGLAAGCAENGGEEQAGTADAESPIGFDAYLSRSTTRAYSPNNQLTTTELKDNTTGKYGKYGFGVFAYYTGTEHYSPANTPEFMHNQQVKWNGTTGVEKWQYSPMKYWPNGYGEAEGNKGSIDVYTSFFAYAPYSPCDPSATTFTTDVSETNRCITDCSGTGETGNPYVRYRIADDPVNQQVDLCYAVPLIDQQKQAVNENLPFNFKHALAGLKVTVDSRLNSPTDLGTVDAATRVYVRSVTFEGFATEGTLNLNSSADKPTWNSYDGTGTVRKQPVVLNDCRRNGREAVDADAGEYTFVNGCLLNPRIIQQGNLFEQPGVTGTTANLFTDTNADFPLFVIPNGAPMRVTITYDVETRDPSLAIDLLSDGTTPGSSIENTITKTVTFGSETTLQAGRTYTLALHLGMGSVELTTSVANWRQNIGVSMEYQLSYDQGATWGERTTVCPSWLEVVESGVDPVVYEGHKLSNPNSTATTILSIVQDRTGVTDRDNELKNATPANDVDLSMKTNAGADRASRTTANCYLVHAPGTYKLPLVYGNAIKDGGTNASAYHTDMTNTYLLSTLVNHADQNIIDPWIQNNKDKNGNNITVSGARLVWQDVPGMISSVGIADDYLTFTVDQTKIGEGNAVLAATMADGTVVWSWHIWVTPETLSNTTTIDTNTPPDGTDGHIYHVAPVNVGQVKGSIKTTTTYAGLQCRVWITDEDGLPVTDFTVVADNYGTSTATHYNPSPYYQWGRKDAELPSIGGYDADGHPVANPALVEGAYSIGTTLQNPDKHFYNSANFGPYNESKYNYWDIDNALTENVTTATKKTVYDPCPPGFCVPTGNLYYYMGNGDGGSTIQGSDFAWSSPPPGRTWTKNSANLFFPASGERSRTSGTLSYVGSYAYYWSASPISSSSGRSLYFSSSAWNWSSGGRAYGMPVRAVLEE